MCQVQYFHSLILGVFAVLCVTKVSRLCIETFRMALDARRRWKKQYAFRNFGIPKTISKRGC
jgi:hypothetical protein